MDKQQLKELCETISEELDEEFNNDSSSLFKLYSQDPQKFDAEGMMFFALTQSRRYTERYVLDVLTRFLEQQQ